MKGCLSLSPEQTFYEPIRNTNFPEILEVKGKSSAAGIQSTQCSLMGDLSSCCMVSTLLGLGLKRK